MKRSFALLISMLLGAVFLVSTGPAATAAPYCGITWGSLAESQRIGSTSAFPTGVRAGQHECFDRMVVDINGEVRGFDVRYVTTVVKDGSGTVVPLRGAADLQVIALVSNYTSTGQQIWRPGNPNELVTLTGFSTFRQVAYAGSFEGQTTFGLGVRARLPFRAFILDGPLHTSRLVVDVAHRW